MERVVLNALFPNVFTFASAPCRNRKTGPEARLTVRSARHPTQTELDRLLSEITPPTIEDEAE